MERDEGKVRERKKEKPRWKERMERERESFRRTDVPWPANFYIKLTRHTECLAQGFCGFLFSVRLRFGFSPFYLALSLTPHHRIAAVPESKRNPQAVVAFSCSQ
ncbi:hypothetical protein ElyMa_003501300 [Elysia marginata]|uniref:Uncharacterized protein n=1 Tax=Elysia marginata TaxID=1093978 RepID=A0AAV4EF19_9GAST|nr:hypothetical protein ElyMa_003501300 [Elysia marginata]